MDTHLNRVNIYTSSSCLSISIPKRGERVGKKKEVDIRKNFLNYITAMQINEHQELSYSLQNILTTLDGNKQRNLI